MENLHLHTGNHNGHAYDVSIILPRYCEDTEIITASLDKIKNFVFDHKVQIIIVNDGGANRGIEEVKQQYPSVTFIDNKSNRGKGFSIRKGVEQAKGRYVFYSDIDLPINLDNLKAALAFMEQSSEIDLLIGLRYNKKSKVVGTSNSYRKITSKFFLNIFNFLLVPNVDDSQCPFKLFRYELASKVFAVNSLNGYAFDAEIIYLATLLKNKIYQYPIEWFDTRKRWYLPKTLLVFAQMTSALLFIKIYWSFNKTTLR